MSIQDPALQDFTPPRPPEVIDDLEAFAQEFNPVMPEDSEVTPLDLLRPGAYTTCEHRDQRLDTCRGCDRFIALTRQCRECLCVMPLKTWLADASCPLGKWGPVG